MASVLILRRPMNLCPIFQQACRRPGHASLGQCQRSLKTSTQPYKKVPDFAFAFEYVHALLNLYSELNQTQSIDGVLLRSSSPLPRAHQALSYLQSKTIPFILLTNGGGKPEAERVQELSERLEIPLSTDMFVQSHTPFQELVEGDEDDEGYRDKCVLVTGGDEDKCRKVAEE